MTPYEALTTSEKAQQGARANDPIDAPHFSLFWFRDGREFGRQLPALWICREGARYSLAIVDEEFLFGTQFKNARVEAGDVLVFELSDGATSRVVRMHLLWRPKEGMIFVERRGVEFVK